MKEPFPVLTTDGKVVRELISFNDKTEDQPTQDSQCGTTKQDGTTYEKILELNVSKEESKDTSPEFDGEPEFYAKIRLLDHPVASSPSLRVSGPGSERNT
mmetsp:Transcript_7644/g.11861  ORF Transcript_7644/g.11861 Transcript_7644/m.11861 type:complete len:100 (+) Transcript_7644:509-808(+)